MEPGSGFAARPSPPKRGVLPVWGSGFVVLPPNHGILQPPGPRRPSPGRPGPPPSNPGPPHRKHLIGHTVQRGQFEDVLARKSSPPCPYKRDIHIFAHTYA